MARSDTDRWAIIFISAFLSVPYDKMQLNIVGDGKF